MGGLLFKSQGAKRVKTIDYELYYKPKVQHLLGQCGIVNYSFFRNIEEKLDHGDMDILVSDSPMLVPTLKFKLDQLGMVYSDNSSVFSLLLDDLQVDLVLTEPCFFEYALDYYSFNDLGGLLGRLAHPLGLKHGFRGLRYLQISERGYGEVSHLLTSNYAEFLDLMGLSYSRFQAGFKTFAEVREFVASSCWFSTSLYELRLQNNKTRARDSKRSSYREMEEFALSRPRVERDYPSNKLDFLISLYPELAEKIRVGEREFAKVEAYHQRLRATSILSLRPDLKLDEIGRFMGQLKKCHPKKKLLDLNQAEYESLIKSFQPYNRI